MSLTHPSPPLESLRRAAANGGPGAQLALGEALLRSGGGLAAYQEAEAAIRAADAAGEAEATARLAMLRAMGLAAPADWPGALSLLARAAEAGSASAQGQLRALARSSGSDWTGLAAAIDLAAWTRPPDRRILSDAPRVRAIDGFVSRQVCDWIVARARDQIAPAKVFDAATGAPAQAKGRSNSALEFAFADNDVVLAMLRGYIAASVGLPPACLEPAQVLHYAVGQAFAPHYDFMDPRVPGYARAVEQGGQRIATFLVYLNDEFEGGETDFPLIPLRARAPAGGALYFANVDEAGGLDRRTLHAGLAPASGEKWLLSQWVRNRVG